MKDDQKEKRRKRSSEEEFENERKVEKVERSETSQKSEISRKSESETAETDTVESDRNDTLDSEPPKVENIRKISRNSDIPSENDTEPEPDKPEVFEPYQLSRDEIDDLEEFILPQETVGKFIYRIINKI